MATHRPPVTPARSRPASTSRIRLTVVGAQKLARGWLNLNFSLPDVFCKIECGSQNWTTETCLNTVNPVWRWVHDVDIGRSDSIIISLWNQKKVNRGGHKGFLGCVRIVPTAISSLKDQGFQRLDLQKLNDDDPDVVRGAIIISLLSKDPHSNNRHQNNVVIQQQETNLRSLNIVQCVPSSTTTSTSNNASSTNNEINSTNCGLNSNRNVSTSGGNSSATSTSRPLPRLPPVDGENRSINNSRDRSHFERNSRSSSARVPKIDRRPLNSNHGNSTSNPQINVLDSSSSNSTTAPTTTNNSNHNNMNNDNNINNNNNNSNCNNNNSINNEEARSSRPSLMVNSDQAINNNPIVNVRRSSRGHRSHSSRNQHNLASNNTSSSTTPTTIVAATTTTATTAATTTAATNNQHFFRHNLPDGYEMRTSDQGQIYFVHLPTDTTTYYDPRVPKQVTDLNLNLDNLFGSLPDGWEKRQAPPSSNSTNRVYFLNHITRTTQFTDPRLIQNLTRLKEILSESGINGLLNRCKSSSTSRHHGLTSSNNHHSHHGHHTHHHRNNSNNNISNSLTSTSVTISSTGSLTTAAATTTSSSTTTTTSTIGCLATNNVNNINITRIHKPPMPLPECDLNNSSSSSSGHINNKLPIKENLIAKMNAFKQTIQPLQTPNGHCRMEVSRKDIFEDSFSYVMKMKTKELRKRLWIKFRGEEAIDYGGVAREWLHLLSREMLNPQYALFKYTADHIFTLQINPDSGINSNHLTYFQFVGRILGIALFHGHHIGCSFTLPFYKMLLGKPVTLEDIRSVDPEFYNGMQWVLKNTVNGLDMTFSVDHNRFGEIQVLDLKPNGREIAVTDDNKEEYIRLYVNYRYKSGIEQQFHYLLKGFNDVVPTECIQQFDEHELEIMISGVDEIDLNDWKENTRIKHCTNDSDIVKWFWKAVESYSEEKRARLLQFVTGSPRVPLQGFKALRGTTGASDPRLFTINFMSDSGTDKLPAAHTCFNRIDLPPYESFEKLLEKLTQAIDETDGFALD